MVAQRHLVVEHHQRENGEADEEVDQRHEDRRERPRISRGKYTLVMSVEFEVSEATANRSVEAKKFHGSRPAYT